MRCLTQHPDQRRQRRIKIEIKGNALADVYGITISSANNLIRGLAVYNFERQIIIRGTNATGNTIAGNFIGTDSALSFQFPGEVLKSFGIRLDSGASNNIIGGTTPQERNIISGNGDDGVVLTGAGTDGNKIIGNFIGVAQDGVTQLANYSDGVDMGYGVQNN